MFNVGWTNASIGSATVINNFIKNTSYRGYNYTAQAQKAYQTFETTWTNRNSAADNNWNNVVYVHDFKLFVAVSYSGAANRVMTSPDGDNWTSRVTNNNNWEDIAYSPKLRLLCAVASSGTNDRVMTSPDGITWTTRTTNNNNWRGIIWVDDLELFVAVADSGTGDRVMTSPDGVTWTTRTSAADNGWLALTYSPELRMIVAVSYSGTGNRVMTSLDGINWTIQASAADNSWNSVDWSPRLKLFAAASNDGVNNRVMTSSDGVTWTTQTTNNNNWRSLKWIDELSIWLAVSYSAAANDAMYSYNGQTWVTMVTPAQSWRGCCWSQDLGILIAVAASGTGNRVMICDCSSTINGIVLSDGDITLPLTVNYTQKGIIFKDTSRFLHDFNYGDNGVVTTNGNNLFLGKNAGNLTMGSTATSVTHSSTNTGIGKEVLNALTIGYGNTVVGSDSGKFMTTGYNNTLVGSTCGVQITSGQGNVAFGYYALVALTEGIRNTSIGNNTFAGLTAIGAADNVGLGYNAGTAAAAGNNTGSIQSIFLGAQTKSSAATNTNEIVIGYNNTGLGSDTCTIGNTSQTLCTIRGTLDLDSGNLDLNNTTNLVQTGIVTKAGTLFIHNFEYGNNGTVTVQGANTCVGVGAGNLTMGSVATATVHSSLNTYIGKDSGTASRNAYGNSFVGSYCGDAVFDAGYNCGMGAYALTRVYNGVHNNGVGAYALQDCDNGARNNAIGYDGLGNIGGTSSNDNVAIGHEAGLLTSAAAANSVCTNSIFIGSNTKVNASSETDQIVIGHGNTGLGSNTCVIGNTSQTLCTIRGDLDLDSGDLDLNNTTNADQTGVVTKAGNRFIHDFNYGFNGVTTTVGFNTFLGELAGNLTMGTTATSVSHSSQNTCVGYNVGAGLTTGSDNSLIGAFAGDAIANGTANSVVGIRALTTASSGSYNSGIGSKIFESLTTGLSNSCVGTESFRYVTTTSDNVAFGYQAGTYYTGGVGNNNTTPTQSIFIGSNTKAATAADTNQIVIGYDNTGLGTNTAVIGNTSQTLCSIRGKLGIGTDSPNSPIEVKSYVVASSGGTAFNRVVSFYSNDSTYQQEYHFGVLPVDVDSVIRFAGGDANGTFGKGYFLKHNKTDNTLEIGINTGGNIDTDSADFSFLSNEMKFLDSGSNSNSSKLSFIGNSGGTEQKGSIFVAYGASPYMRVSVPNAAGAETAVIDIDDDKMTFVTDNSMDIGQSGANRPKDIYAAGSLTFGSVKMTYSEVLDIDTTTATVDTFADTAGNAAFWSVVVYNTTTPANTRAFNINAVWNAAADTIDPSDESIIAELGDTSAVSFSVDINSDNVRLRCTTTSDDWAVKVSRTLI